MIGKPQDPIKGMFEQYLVHYMNDVSILSDIKTQSTTDS